MKYLTLRKDADTRTHGGGGSELLSCTKTSAENVTLTGDGCHVIDWLQLCIFMDIDEL